MRKNYLKIGKVEMTEGFFELSTKVIQKISKKKHLLKLSHLE